MKLKYHKGERQDLKKLPVKKHAGRSVICILVLALGVLAGCSEDSRSYQTYHVNAAAKDDGDGLSWDSAFTHPQDALDVSSCGDVIWVAAGTYTPSEPDGREVVRLVEGVDLLGGFGGFETLSLERDPGLHVTVLDGQRTAYHVVMGAEGAVLDGFTVTGGRADGNTVQSQYGGTFKGGGMFNVGVSPEIRNCLFNGNEAVAGGGAIYNEAGRPVIENCIFTQNRANFGGAVENRNSGARVVNSIFQNNESYLSGGAVANFGGAPTFLNAVFSGNLSNYVGGGMLSNKSDSIITNCSFTGNSSGTEGGGIGMWEGRARITNCIFWDNRTSDGSEIKSIRSGITVNYSIVQGGYAGTGNLDTPPGFVEAGIWLTDGQWIDGDYRLAAVSAAVDSGTAEGAPDFDVEYTLRPQALAHDLGAYERSAP